MKNMWDYGLFGAGLVEIDTSELITRYNECLKRLGIEPVTEEPFHVDGIGWSPEIAKIKKDDYYLSHGIANQLAIIIRPDQIDMPIWFPYSSFDRTIMSQYFSKYEKKINDITLYQPIWLDFDQNLVVYQNPRNLLLVDKISVVSNIGELKTAVIQQKALTKKILSDDHSWTDLRIEQNIIQLSKKYGDLRSRRVNIPPFDFHVTCPFYTQAFGGIYVFKDLNHFPSIIIMKNKFEYKKYYDKKADIIHIQDKELLNLLKSEELLELNLDWYKKNIEELKNKLAFLWIDNLAILVDDIDFTEMNSAQLKSIIHDHKDELNPKLFEFERLIKHLEADNQIKEKHIDPEMKKWLWRPVPTLDTQTRKIIWDVLCAMGYCDPLRLYIADKNTFFQRYMSWPKAKKNGLLSGYMKDTSTIENYINEAKE